MTCPSCGMHPYQHPNDGCDVVEFYRECWIRYYYLPQFARFAWEHKNYDGAPIDSEGPPADNRCGYAKTIEECRQQIDNQIDEGNDE